MVNATKIMIVEDNTTVARDLRDCLLGLGYGVTCSVASAEESIEKADAERPDAVIMDIQLRDEMDGIEAAEIICARYGIPVVFLSAYSDRALIERAKRVGSFGYLVKPFEEHELHAALEMALYKAEAEKKHRQMEARLRRAQKLEGLGVMAGSIAHNFNNILQVALSFTELALEKLPPDAEARGHLHEVENAVLRAAEMSTLMGMYAGQGQREKRDVNLSNLVQIAARMLCSAIRGRVSISMNLAHEDAAIQADPAQLNLLITNLFTNAVEAIGAEPGTIRIATRVAALECDELKETYLHKELPAGDYAILELADTGPGMDEETIGKVFDPFFTTKFTGRGLGLAAVLGIVRGHKGAIAIDSKPGEGTTFRVLFPVTGIFEASVAKQGAAVEERQRTGTILLVDDEDAVRKVEALMLQRIGYTVISAADGREAVEIFREHADEIDCVLLDLTMPHMDGEQVFGALRRICPDVKVILCSGYKEQVATQRFAANCLAGFIQKPYKMATLEENLMEVLM